MTLFVGIFALFLLMLIGAPLFIVISGLTLWLLLSAQIDSSAMIIEM
ncbi:MAG: C4-dicarboxylate ABC transporter, partial [Syntrophus sp. (in: bacteria)]|nr:C4-dicarboxylate ABC transporter [Syntrophus sp. (in: bacteria)]